MAKIQIRRQNHPNDENCRFYYSHESLTDQPVEGERGDPDNQNEVLIQVLTIKGVMYAKVGAYVIVVIKSPMHEWSTIEPQMLRLLTAFNLPLSLSTITEGEEVNGQ